jgi:hypothetical protein
MFEFDSKPSEEDALQREAVFSLDGEVYSIPARPWPTPWSLRYAQVRNTRGEGEAVLWILEKALGEEGFNALGKIPERFSERVDRIVALVGARVNGQPDPVYDDGPAPVESEEAPKAPKTATRKRAAGPRTAKQ